MNNQGSLFFEPDTEIFAEFEVASQCRLPGFGLHKWHETYWMGRFSTFAEFERALSRKVESISRPSIFWYAKKVRIVRTTGVILS